MQLYKEIRVGVLSKKKVKVIFENLNEATANELVENAACKCVQRIANILKNDELDDFECVERIVCLLNDLDVDTGSRHDFS